MLWSMHLGRAARMSRSSRARYQPRFETLENRLTPTTDMLPPLVGGDPFVASDLSAPEQMPVIAAEAPSDSVESPGEAGGVGAEEPPLIVGGEGTLSDTSDDQASEVPPEEEAPVMLPPPPVAEYEEPTSPSLPPVAGYEEPTAPSLPPVGQFEPPPVPSLPTSEMPPDIVHWGADEIVPTPSAPSLPTPAVSIGEAASGFGEEPYVAVSTPSIPLPAAVSAAAATTGGTASTDAVLSAWLSPAATQATTLVAYHVDVVDEAFSTPTTTVATTTAKSDFHADLFGVGSDVSENSAETDLLADATRIVKARAAAQHEAEETETEAEAEVEASEHLVAA